MDRAVQGLYSVDDAMKYLGGIGRGKIYSYINEDKLASIQVGRRRFFTKDQLDAFVQDQVALN